MTTPKMLFINDKGFIFCDKGCDRCPIRYICFTNKVVAFDVTVDVGTSQLVSCVPHPIKGEPTFEISSTNL